MLLNAVTILSVATLNRSSIAVLYPQYIEYPNTTSLVSATVNYQKNTKFVRKRIVGLEYHVDITLSSTGFAGTENIDWTNLFIHVGQDAVFRSGSRGGFFVVDAEISVTGFAGVEDTDWENLFKTKHPTSSETKFRDGVRSGAYVVDQELTATGFSGTEGIDWINLLENKPL